MLQKKKVAETCEEKSMYTPLPIEISNAVLCYFSTIENKVKTVLSGMMISAAPPLLPKAVALHAVTVQERMHSR